MILELSDNQSERIAQLKEQLSKDVGDYTTRSVIESLSEFFTKHKQVFIDNGLSLPASVEIDYDFQSDDEGGSNPYITSVSLFDKDGEWIDDWRELKVDVKSNYSDNVYKYDLEEAIIDCINNNVDINDIYNETSCQFNITIGE